MMKDTFIRSIVHNMSGILDGRQLEKLKNVIFDNLKNYDLVESKESSSNHEQENKYYLDMFISAKSVEGCSESTLKYYHTTIDKLLSYISKEIKSIDNVRRILSSFFSWLEDEDYIVKSPVRRIHKVKTAKTVKETLTDENLEVLRDTCCNLRDLTIIEMLTSTGVRVGELVKLNRSDINFNERSCIVFGKGSKEREVYFDARTKLHLTEYLDSRNDDNEALFVSKNSPHSRLTIGAIQKIVRNLGKQADITRVHPHKFRRTLATRAIDKGMPIEQVQMLLGHQKIETTMHYAMVDQSNVKISHRKFIG